MAKVSVLPRVIYCGPEDALFRKLALNAGDFVLEGGVSALGASPQKLARVKKASALILKVRKQFDLRHQEWLSRNDATIPVLVLCQDGSVELAVHALQYGVFDYFCANQNLDVTLRRIREAIAWKETRPLRRQKYQDAGTLLHGSDPQIVAVNERAGILAKESKPILVYGESGTGKEHLAYGMYRLMFPGGLTPFIRYDCRLLQQMSRYDGKPVPDIIQSRIQEFKNRSVKGVLFLDHLEQIPGDQQEALLERSTNASLRLIASYQLPAPRLYEEKPAASLPSIHIPPLRHRKNDIPALADHFIAATAHNRKMRGKSLSGEMILLMQEYPWPGNVKELGNLIERMMLIEPSPVISQSTWRVCQGYGPQLNLDGANRLSGLVEAVLNQGEWKSGNLYDGFMEEMKRVLVRMVLSRVNYNQAIAARILGISRNTLRDLTR